MYYVVVHVVRVDYGRLLTAGLGQIPTSRNTPLNLAVVNLKLANHYNFL